MKEVDVQLPTRLNAGAVEATFEIIAREAVLTVTMNDTPKKFPGCVHWHLKRDKEPGVLEVTWWPDDGKKRASRLWFSAHRNRQADWMLDLTPTLKRKIEISLATGSCFGKLPLVQFAAFGTKGSKQTNAFAEMCRLAFVVQTSDSARCVRRQCGLCCH